ncbi:hypothetical protein [Streptomyces sp. AC1-42T]|uniref:hypothetical protein n=1 Tax=Streptomyces sp. AC1-42T TaxID=2218665 RepID=UPI000DAB4D22|nr:hypothetical protein [Streptomyces sp. AC1-42T]PZT71559.1 hypothetical protein DNK55_33175 [Streptomyces sp. AC1-42T]
MTTITPVTLEGHTGLDEDSEAANAKFWESLKRWAAANPGQDSQPEAMRLVALNDTLRRYNMLRPLLLREEVAREERDRALAQVEVLWRALGDPAATQSWLHCHQAYVRAVQDARIALDMWRDRATDAKKVPYVHDGDGGARKAAYDQILAAGHPPVEPLTIDPKTVAEQLLTNLEQAHEYRTRLAAETAGLLQQAGNL